MLFRSAAAETSAAAMAGMGSSGRQDVPVTNMKVYFDFVSADNISGVSNILKREKLEIGRASCRERV